MLSILGGFNMPNSRSSRRPGYGPHRGSLNPKITVISSTASTTGSQFPVDPKKHDMLIDGTSSPVEVYWYDGTSWNK